MHNVVIIPARGGSKGIKLKNLKKINGKSLIQITLEFAKSLSFADYIVVNVLDCPSRMLTQKRSILLQDAETLHFLRV